MIMDQKRDKRERMITRGIERGMRILQQGRRISLGMSRVRMGVVLVGILVCVVLYKFGWFVTGNWALLGFLLCFLGVAHVHYRLERRLRRLETWLEIQKRQVARLRVDWNGMPETTMRLSSDHPYGADLDLVGQHSLFRLLDTTISQEGQALLVSWLAHQHPFSFDQWESRQKLVQALAPLPGLRNRIQLVAKCVSAKPINADRLGSLLEAPLPVARLGPLFLAASGLAGLNIVLFGFWFVGGVPGYWIVSFLAYALLMLLTGGRLSHVFERTLDLHMELDKLAAVIGLFEKRSFRRLPALQAVIDPWQAGLPSAAIKQLARICSGLSLKAHPILHIAMHVVVPWDLAWTWVLQRVCGRLRPMLPDWIERLSTIDAAMAMATFAYLNPSYAWPRRKLEGADLGISGTAIGHPLIAHQQRINNDLTLEGLGRVLLVTGSNMSGKSTFLRTVGINVCLAQAGGPVCAGSWDWSWLRIQTCIRVGDVLEEGLSYFYVEVKRLKTLLVAMGDHREPPVLFLIDEIFKGTNNRERLLGSEAFIRELTAGRGLGLVTTHDLELAKLEKELPSLANVHFQETVGDKELTFDYRLRPGPCSTTNALRIMAMEGLPVPETTSGS